MKLSNSSWRPSRSRCRACCRRPPGCGHSRTFDEDPLADAEIDLVALDGAAIVERLVAPARAPTQGDAQAFIVEAARLVAQPAMMAGGIGGVEAGVAALGQLLRRQFAQEA